MDTNAGTAEKPLRTINAAAQQAQAGDTVLVQGGIYRERISPARGGTEGKPIVYQAAPGETVIVRGSDVWTHWVPMPGQAGVFTADIGSHVAADAPNPFLIGISISAQDADIVARPAPATGKLLKTLGQVFFDGRPVTEVDSESIVASLENTWVVSRDGRQILAHFPGQPADLAPHLVEVTVRNRLFAPQRRGLDYIQVRGFTFEHCANQGPFPQGGAVSTRSGSHWLIEGNTIRFAKTVGVDIGSETWEVAKLKETATEQKVRMEGGHNIVQGNTVSDNGLVGIEGWHHNGAVIRGNVVERNNALGFDQSNADWEEWGGIKLHGPGALIEGNLVRDNEAHGIWIDNDYTDSRITRNLVVGNRMAGIFLELGDGRCLVDNNIVALTRPRDEMYGGMGIYAHDASGLVIVHNLVLGNADCGVLLRTVSDRVFPAEWKPGSKPVRTTGTRVLNNIIWNNSKAAISLPYPNDRAGDNLSDYNVVYGSRDLWLGFESNPGLFGVNLYKSSLTADQLVEKFKDALEKGKFAVEESPNLKSWRRNPTLPLAQWRVFMGQDLHSKEAPKMVTLMLRPAAPAITYKADLPVLHMECPAVEGVDRDYFGRPLKPEGNHPGPFQNLSQAETEASLFPIAP